MGTNLGSIDRKIRVDATGLIRTASLHSEVPVGHHYPFLKGENLLFLGIRGRFLFCNRSGCTRGASWGFQAVGLMADMHRKGEWTKEDFSDNNQHVAMSEQGGWELYQLLRLR